MHIGGVTKWQLQTFKRQSTPACPPPPFLHGNTCVQRRGSACGCGRGMAGHTGCEEDEFKGRLQKLHSITCRDSSFSSPEGAQEHTCKGMKRGGQVGRGQERRGCETNPCALRSHSLHSAWIMCRIKRDDKIEEPLHWK